MNSVGYTRWDPKTRAGAVAIRPSRAHDIKTVETISDHVAEWAKYQNLAGECDTVESSSISGNYDWRSYIQEEAHLARRREEQDKPRPKKAPERPEPAAAPTGFYA